MQETDVTSTNYLHLTSYQRSRRHVEFVIWKWRAIGPNTLNLH